MRSPAPAWMDVACWTPGGTLWFRDPREIITAWDTAEVASAFRRVDRALAAGCYVAGYATYELGSHIVPRQSVAAAGQPLLALGIYESPALPRESSPNDYTLGPLVSLVSRSRYARDIATILAGIREGDVYQVNYSVPFAFDFAGDPYALFCDLNADDVYPAAAYVETSHQAFVSCSPELFMHVEPGRITTKPMKGTVRPGEGLGVAGSKDHAEHIMIVDLLRNDLHRLSPAVCVEKLCSVEHYRHFSTMTSTITGAVPPQAGSYEIFEALFPCGSVTGAPKGAAMQFIAQTEQRERGIFCGTIGYFGPGGTGCWNVAIRTASIDKTRGRGRLDVGGGIVAESTAQGEWDEILTKRRFFAVKTPPVGLDDDEGAGIVLGAAGHVRD